MKTDYTYRVFTAYDCIPKIEKLIVVKRTEKQVVYKNFPGGCEQREALKSDYAIHFKSEKLAKEYCTARATNMIKKYSTLIEQCAKVLVDNQ